MFNSSENQMLKFLLDKTTIKDISEKRQRGNNMSYAIGIIGDDYALVGADKRTVFYKNGSYDKTIDGYDKVVLLNKNYFAAAVGVAYFDYKNEKYSISDIINSNYDKLKNVYDYNDLKLILFEIFKDYLNKDQFIEFLIAGLNNNESELHHFSVYKNLLGDASYNDKDNENDRNYNKSIGVGSFAFLGVALKDKKLSKEEAIKMAKDVIKSASLISPWIEKHSSVGGGYDIGIVTEDDYKLISGK